MRALIGREKAAELTKDKLSMSKSSKKNQVVEDSDSDCGLEFEDASTNGTEKKTFRDLLTLNKVSFTDKFGKPKPGDYDKAAQVNDM